tara:strand:- start:1010 stop:1516 length:507 start_codon:yes stop_codon:yes gene_type:complete
MNLILVGTIIFVIIYLFLNWFAKTSSKKIAQFLKRLAILFSMALAVILAVGGKFIFSLPFLLILLTGLKIKGFTAFQIFQLWRLIQFYRNSGRYRNDQFGKSRGSTNISVTEAYKLLGLKKGCNKQDIIKAAAKLQKKIHPDVNRDINTEELSKLVNEAKEKLLKELV